MRGQHPLLPNLDEETIERMLRKVGASSVEELFSDIPARVRLKRRLRIPGGESEYTVRRNVTERLSSNITPPRALCFLGGGVWPHYIPAAVESIVSRQEFYTSYTPYQAEMSQGMLQALFEYQSLMCDLLEMEACNSSMYDWASAAAEAVRMAVRVNGRGTVLVGSNIGMERYDVLRAYAEPLSIRIERVRYDRKSGRLDLDDLRRRLSDDVCAVYFENPNHFGVIEEDAEDIVRASSSAGALSIVGVDPVSLSVLKPPGAYGADIAVGEGQPLGIPMNYGGPHLGIFAVKDMKLARSMPGRLIGLTTTVDGSQKAFAMVLQTREQHIRREAATSNICTNQALMAVAAGSYLALLGRHGFKRLGEVVLSNSHYAAERLAEVRGLVCPLFEGSFFKEFAVGYRRAKAARVYRGLAKKGIMGGYPLAGYGIGTEAGLYCVTEVHTVDDIERLADSIRGLV